MVSDFTVGDRVGVGFLGGHCDFVNCENQPHTGLTADGGYAEMVYGRASGRPDALVAIQGIGGLGHLGVQYASKLGYRWWRLHEARKKRLLQQNSALITSSTAPPSIQRKRCNNSAAPPG